MVEGEGVAEEAPVRLGSGLGNFKPASPRKEWL